MIIGDRQMAETLGVAKGTVFNDIKKFNIKKIEFIDYLYETVDYLY